MPASLDDLQEQLEASRLFAWNCGDPPDVLYHYTGADGALGILSADEFWASDALFVNDAKEIRYGADILNKTWDGFNRTGGGAKATQILDHLVKAVTQI